MSDSDPRAGLGRTPLWKEITVILVIKAAALCLIWLAFFSGPVDKQVDVTAVAAPFFKPSLPSVDSSPPRGPGHAARH